MIEYGACPSEEEMAIEEKIGKLEQHRYKEKKYTVVGLYPDTDEDFVEWVEAESVEDAVANAVVMADGRDEAAIVAVFAGHHLDLTEWPWARTEGPRSIGSTGEGLTSNRHRPRMFTGKGRGQ
jgi:hypothetical protein